MRISDWSSDVCSSDLNGPALYSGRFRADGRIVTATPGLRSLHERCGGGATDPVAVPGLPSLIRRAASLKMPLGASVLIADGRSEQRRGGKEWVSTFRSRCALDS